MIFAFIYISMYKIRADNHTSFILDILEPSTSEEDWNRPAVSGQNLSPLFIRKSLDVATTLYLYSLTTRLWRDSLAGLLFINIC